MNLHTSAGWRRLGFIAVIVLAAPCLGTIGFAILNIQAFMRSVWAVWTLLGCVLTIYSIAYVADWLRRREARSSVNPAGDSSPLIYAGVADTGGAGSRVVATTRSRGPVTRWIWVGLIVVAGYAGFRFAWAMANGAGFDWTIVVALVLVAASAVVMPSVVAWQTFQRSAAQVGGSGTSWPVFRTDQFAEELHRVRPGATIPQELMIVGNESEVAVWTTERQPRLLLSMPRDASTGITAVAAHDRLGTTAVRLERKENGQTVAFDLIVRRKGSFTYFRVDQAVAQQCASEIGSARFASGSR